MSAAPEEPIVSVKENLAQPTPVLAASSSGGSGGVDKSLPPRRERSKSRDAGKRMGGGQKASWKVTEIPRSVSADEHDPNYDSEAEENVVFVSTAVGSPQKSTPTLEPDELAAKELALNPPPEIKKRIIEVLEEYFISGDADEVLSSLNDLDEPEFNYEVVKRSITMAMDRNDKERELTSRLLSALYLDGLTAGQVLMGFRRVLLLAGDLQIDIPCAKNMLAIFCARAVVDEILPPSFLEDPFITRYAPEIASEAIKKLSINHATARMEKAWGPGDGRPVEELKVAIDQLTKEYLLSRDLDEAARCVRELNVPHFHHEVVKRGINNSLEEGGEANSAAMASLLAYLVSNEVVSTGQLIKGFERFKFVLDDVALDIPNAAALFKDIVARGISDGILPKDFDASATRKN
ncbi:putative programmed cell death protein [Plasmopara halstedii]